MIKELLETRIRPAVMVRHVYWLWLWIPLVALGALVDLRAAAACTRGGLGARPCVAPAALSLPPRARLSTDSLNLTHS